MTDPNPVSPTVHRRRQSQPQSRPQPEQQAPAADSSLSPDEIEFSSRREQLARSGLARFFNMGILSSRVWNLFDSLDTFRIAYIGTAVSNLAHLVKLQVSLRPRPGSTDGTQLEMNSATGVVEGSNLSGVGIDGTNATISDQETPPEALHYPHPPIRPPKPWRPGPEVWGLSTQADMASDLSSFPAPSVRDALVAAYFEYIHPILPVIPKTDFLTRYHDAQNPPALLLYQAVLMAGSHACSHPAVVKHRQAFKTILFRRASMLFHLRHETDRLQLLQAAVLFTWHIGDGDSIAGGPYYWSGIAVRIGYGLGVHRHSPTLPRVETAEYKRAWWCAFVCEIFSSLETGRPCSIRPEEIDQTPFSDGDMAVSRLEASSSDAEVDAHFLSCMVQLSYIGLEIATINAPTHSSLIDVRSLDTRLGLWSIRSGISSSSGDGRPLDSQLRLHYHLLLLYLHRNLPGESHSQSMCATSAQSILSILEKIAADGWLPQCHFATVSAVTAAGIQLVNEIRVAVMSYSHLAAMHAIERLSRLLRLTSMLTEYWPNAEAIYTVFKELHHEFETCTTNGLLGEEIKVPDIPIDWNPLLFGIDLSMCQFDGVDLNSYQSDTLALQQDEPDGGPAGGSHI